VLKLLTLSSFLVLISCTYKVNNNTKYEKTYSITLKNKTIGYCGKLKNKYLCKIFLKNRNKSLSYKISMLKNDNYVEYSSPSVKFSKKIKSKHLIYPFLFENISKDTLIYYPEMDIYIKAEYLSIKKIKNGYIATPFKYIKVKEVPREIQAIDILEFREIKSNLIKKQYPSKYIINFKSEDLPPSDLRQSCKRLSKKNIECQITNETKTNKINHPKTKDNINKKIEKSVLLFIKKHKLKGIKPQSLIPKLIEAVHKEIKYKDISKKMTTKEILELKQGDCTEFSQLSVDILRALGISAKRIYGLIYRAKKSKWIYHSWVEYSNNNYNYSFDPVNKQGFINLNYLKLGEENKYGIIIIPLDIENLIFKEVN